MIERKTLLFISGRSGVAEKNLRCGTVILAVFGLVETWPLAEPELVAGGPTEVVWLVTNQLAHTVTVSPVFRELSFRLCAVPASVLHFGGAAWAGADSEIQQAIRPPAKITPKTLRRKFMREG